MVYGGYRVVYFEVEEEKSARDERRRDVSTRILAAGTSSTRDRVPAFCLFCHPAARHAPPPALLVVTCRWDTSQERLRATNTSAPTASPSTPTHHTHSQKLHTTHPS